MRSTKAKREPLWSPDADSVPAPPAKRVTLTAVSVSEDSVVLSIEDLAAPPDQFLRLGELPDTADEPLRFRRRRTGFAALWKAIRESPRAIAAAVVLHVGFIAALAFNLEQMIPQTPPTPSRVIHAYIVDTSRLQAQQQQMREAKERVLAEEAERRKLQEQRAVEAQRAQEEKERQQREAAEAQQRLADTQAKAERIAAEKAEAERLAAEKAKAEHLAKLKRQREAKRRRAEELAMLEEQRKPVAPQLKEPQPAPVPQTPPSEAPAPSPSQSIEVNVNPVVRVPPQYPALALRQGIEGVVTVEFTIAKDGSVKDPVVVSSKPSGIFDQAVMKVIGRWKFEPHMVNGVPIEQRARQDVYFKLRNA